MLFSCSQPWQAIEGGWRLEVGLVVTGIGLTLHWLVGGVIMPLRFHSQLLRSTYFCGFVFLVFFEKFQPRNWQLCFFIALTFRMGECKGFALGTYLIFNVAGMLWQVISINNDIMFNFSYLLNFTLNTTV